MAEVFESPQDAEDAFYDAMEAGDAEAVYRVWDDSDAISCLLPMQPLAQGRSQVAQVFNEMLSGGRKIELAIKHIAWVEQGEFAIHTIEEKVAGPVPNGQPAMSVYAFNIFRRSDNGWRLLMHQNAPTPPPPGAGQGQPPR